MTIKTRPLAQPWIPAVGIVFNDGLTLKNEPGIPWCVKIQYGFLALRAFESAVTVDIFPMSTIADVIYASESTFLERQGGER